MKTQITKKIITETELAEFGYWDSDAEKFVKITPNNLNEISVDLAVPPMYLEMLMFLFVDLRERVQEDLLDIWKRLDSLEKETI
jgi:hypothetical protein